MLSDSCVEEHGLNGECIRLELPTGVSMKRTLSWDVVFTDALQDHTVSIFNAEE
jgi:hypothetical protein